MVLKIYYYTQNNQQNNCRGCNLATKMPITLDVLVILTQTFMCGICVTRVSELCMIECLEIYMFIRYSGIYTLKIINDYIIVVR